MNTIAQLLVDWLKRTYLEPVIRSLKAQAAHVYVETIKGSRRVLVLLCLLVFVITLIGAGLVLFPIALTLLFTDNPEIVGIVGTVLGAVYLLIPAVAMVFLLSEKRWLAVTGAEETAKRIME